MKGRADRRAASEWAPPIEPGPGTAVDAPASVDDAAATAAEPEAAPASRRLLWGLVAVVNVPVLVATVRTLAGGWLPLGDNGILLVRARDVGTAHNPLLGSSSSSFVLGDHVNKPGAFDALALPVRLLGPWVGLAVGVMLVNMAPSTLAVVAARRLGGDAVMVAVAVGVAGLQWAMGSELLFDVWQPKALILPTMAFLVVAAAVATADLAMARGWPGWARCSSRPT